MVGAVVSILAAAFGGVGIVAEIDVVIVPLFALLTCVGCGYTEPQVVLGARNTVGAIDVGHAIEGAAPPVDACAAAVEHACKHLLAAVAVEGVEYFWCHGLVFLSKRALKVGIAVLAVAVAAADECSGHPLLAPFFAEAVRCAHACLAVVAVAETVLVSVASGQEIGAGGGAFVVVHHLVEGDLATGPACLVDILVVVVQPGHCGALCARGHLFGCPCVVFTGLARVIEVIDVGDECHAGRGVEPVDEGAAKVAVLAAVAALGVDEPAYVVLAFEAHVHGQHLGCRDVVAALGVRGLTLIDLHVLDGVGRDVFEHEVVVAVKELLAVEQQRLHKLAVDLDLAVAVELHARQLRYQHIQHRPFGKLEGVGVVHDRVALVVEFDFGGFHRQLAQLFGGTLHEDGAYVAPFFALADFAGAVVDYLRVVAGAEHLDEISRVHLGHA